MDKTKKITSIFLLLLSTLFWGGGFVFVKWLKPYLNPFESNHLRFFLAALIVVPYIIYMRSVKKVIQPWKTPAIAAIFVYLMLTLQTWGIYFTSVAKAGFLTTLYVILIPIFLWISEKRKFSRHFIFCCLLSVLGVFLLNDANFSDWTKGDSLVTLCAIFAAIHIIYIEKVQSKIQHAFLFNAEQCLYLGFYALCMSFLHDQGMYSRVMQFDHLAWMGILSLSILSSIIAFGFQVYAQANVPSQVAGILFLLESPFAALLAFLWLGESLTLMALFGACIVILASILIISKNSKS
jgi:drug/metabolite transporter (DMT)-like permease